MTNLEEFGNRLKNARTKAYYSVENKRLTLQDLAELVSNQIGGKPFSLQTLSNWELGAVRPKNREIICITISIIYTFGGLKNKKEADKILEFSDYRPLDDAEFSNIELFSNNFTENQYDSHFLEVFHHQKAKLESHSDTFTHSVHAYIKSIEWKNISNDIWNLFFSIRKLEILVIDFSYNPSPGNLDNITDLWRNICKYSSDRVKNHCNSIITIGDDRVTKFINLINSNKFIAYGILELEVDKNETCYILKTYISSFWSSFVDLINAVFDYFHDIVITNP